MVAISEQLKKLKLKGKTIGFFLKSGTVVDNKVWSETEVSSSSLFTNVPRISSKVTTKKEIWIRSDDGKEFNIAGNEHIKVNDGHKVTVVYAGFKDLGWPVCIVNRTTNYWHPVNRAEWFVKQKLGLTPVGILVYVGPPVALIMLGLKFGGMLGAVLAVPWLFIAFMFRAGIMDTVYKKRFEKHIKLVAESLF